MSQGNLENLTVERGFIRRHSEVISAGLREKIKLNGTDTYDVIIEFKDPGKLSKNRALARELLRSNQPGTISFIERSGIDYEPFGKNDGLVATLSAEQIESLIDIDEIKSINYSPPIGNHHLNPASVRDYYLSLE
jgi:hypothetical protein